MGGFLEIVPGCQGPWFSLEVDRSWAPWAFSKSSPNKVIAALELLATLMAVKLWIPDSEDRQTSRVADDLTNEKFDSFDPEFRVPLKGEDMRWRVLDKLLSCADNFYGELKKRKAAPVGPSRKAGKIRKLDPW